MFNKIWIAFHTACYELNRINPMWYELHRINPIWYEFHYLNPIWLELNNIHQIWYEDDISIPVGMGHINHKKSKLVLQKCNLFINNLTTYPQAKFFLELSRKMRIVHQWGDYVPPTQFYVMLAIRYSCKPFHNIFSINSLTMYPQLTLFCNLLLLQSFSECIKGHGHRCSADALTNTPPGATQ